MDAAEIDRLRRASGVRLRADGVFMYGAAPVANERVQRLFHAGVEVRPSGEVILGVGRSWCYLETEGVAYFAERADVRRGEVWLTLIGREAAVGPARVGYGPDDRFYAWVDGLHGPVVLLRDAHQALSGMLASGGELGAGGLVALAAIPGANAVRP